MSGLVLRFFGGRHQANTQEDRLRNLKENELCSGLDEMASAIRREKDNHDLEENKICLLLGVRHSKY
jgi:hypothetical protein